MAKNYFKGKTEEGYPTLIRFDSVVDVWMTSSSRVKYLHMGSPSSITYNAQTAREAREFVEAYEAYLESLEPKEEEAGEKAR